MKKISKTSKIICSLVLATVLIACGVGLGLVKADMVEIESGENCDLTYYSMNGHYNSGVWDNQGSLSGDSSTKYILKSNGWAHWYKHDNLSFAYKELAFNYSEKAQITVETTMTSFDGSAENAGAGIMLRTSLNPDAASLMLHYRPGSIMVTYRSKDGTDALQGRTIITSTASMYPVTFKVVVVKGQTKAKCYYKIGSGNFSEFATVALFYDSKIYAGISAYSQQQDFISTAKFTNFKYLVEAPEGYTVVDGGDTSSGEASSEETVSVPEDLAPAGDILMRETFSDGSVENNNGDAQNDIINPIWKYSELPDIQLNSDNTNRYVYDFIKDHSYYYAGDQHWTDYITSYRVNFTNEYSQDEANEFYVYTRLTDIMQYGYQYYFVKIKMNVKQNNATITLGYSPANNYLRVDNEYAEVVETVTITDDLSTIIDRWIDLTVETFDNHIVVCWDGQTVFDWYDEGQYVNPVGCVGFGSNGAAVMVDDITVKKLTDLLGGDYDNRICGNWNQNEPEYYERFKAESAAY